MRKNLWVLVLALTCVNCGEAENDQPASRDSKTSSEMTRPPANLNQAIADAATKLNVEIPKLSGDRALDKAALVKAITELDEQWKKNSAAFESLSRDNSLKSDDPRVIEAKDLDQKFKTAAAELHALLDQIREE